MMWTTSSKDYLREACGLAEVRLLIKGLAGGVIEPPLLEA